MLNEAATDRIKRDLHGILDRMCGDLDRVELLAAALNIFNCPVPDYEPRFHHLHRVMLNAQELGNAADQEH